MTYSYLAIGTSSTYEAHCLLSRHRFAWIVCIVISVHGMDLLWARDEVNTQTAIAARLSAAIGNDGYARYDETQAEVVIVLDEEPDKALANLAKVDIVARLAVKDLTIRIGCKNDDAWAHIKVFRSLKSLSVTNVPWRRTLSASIREMPSLDSLWAEDTRIPGEDLRIISKGRRWRILMLADNCLKGDDLVCLA